MGRLHALSARVRSEGGFTLVELLVTMVAGLVVLSALFTVLDVSLNQTSRTFSKVSADQNARNATDQIENELHSGCVGGSEPVQASSDGNDLIFVSQYGSSASANATVPTPVEHKVVFSPVAGTHTGTLTDYIYTSTGGSAPNWTWSSVPTSTQLLNSATAISNPNFPGGYEPVFQYFSYTEPTSNGTPYTDAAGNSYMMIQDGINYLPGSSTIKPAAAPLSTPLSAGDAGNTAEVLISLVAGPATDSGLVNASGVAATIQDQVALRLTPPSNHAGDGATFQPCS